MFKNLDETSEVLLPQTGSWPKAVHVFDEDSKWAIKAAIAAERPLLVRGEPGTGKSQLARAAAVVLDRAFISEVVHARSECQDLQYHFDAIARLGEAQLLSSPGNSQNTSEALDTKKFLCPGALWWAFNWNSAEIYYKDCNKSRCRPDKPHGWTQEKGSVLLIDEIDKADADLPNGLLEALGNGSFSVPYLKDAIRKTEETPTPFVVITTNEERELPRAFLRRCMVLHMKLPEERNELVDHLVMRGKAHFENMSESILNEVAELLADDRKKAGHSHHVKPGQAEYIDILRALNNLKLDEGDKILKFISKFALVKHPKDNF